MAEEIVIDRFAIAGRGRRLEYFTIAWNSLEGVVAVVAGLVAGSISLVGFGIDSFIEVTSGAALLWRMKVDADVDRREQNERLALRIVGLCFIALAAYITYESIADLIRRQAPEHSIPGIVLACVSLLVMPLLSRAKRRVGTALGSAAMQDAKQTDFCAYLSAILLCGLLLNALFGLWWAEPVAAWSWLPSSRGKVSKVWISPQLEYLLAHLIFRSSRTAPRRQASSRPLGLLLTPVAIQTPPPQRSTAGNSITRKDASRGNSPAT